MNPSDFKINRPCLYLTRLFDFQVCTEASSQTDPLPEKDPMEDVVTEPDTCAESEDESPKTSTKRKKVSKWKFLENCIMCAF